MRASAATDTRLDEAGIDRSFRGCGRHEYVLVVFDALEDLHPDSANLNDGAGARRILHPLMLLCQESAVVSSVLPREGKTLKRNGAHVGAGSIQLITALRDKFPVVQCQDEDHQLLPERQLVPGRRILLPLLTPSVNHPGSIYQDASNPVSAWNHLQTQTSITQL